MTFIFAVTSRNIACQINMVQACAGKEQILSLNLDAARPPLQAILDTSVQAYFPVQKTNIFHEEFRGEILHVLELYLPYLAVNYQVEKPVESRQKSFTERHICPHIPSPCVSSRSTIHKQLQDEASNISVLGFVAPHIRGLTVYIFLFITVIKILFDSGTEWNNSHEVLSKQNSS